MHLMYNLDASGKRLYTLKKVMDGQVTKSAHPARFSPDDKWSRHRITLRKRFNLLMPRESECHLAVEFGKNSSNLECELTFAQRT